jgi:hypothetical protein
MKLSFIQLINNSLKFKNIYLNIFDQNYIRSIKNTDKFSKLSIPYLNEITPS